jgi:hypothetical protein
MMVASHCSGVMLGSDMFQTKLLIFVGDDERRTE